MAEWSWKITADACAICRNSLMEPSIEYQANPVSASEDGLSVSWGTCGHVFHLDCISKWVMKGTRTHCPLCSKEWDIQKIDKARAYCLLRAFLHPRSRLLFSLTDSAGLDGGWSGCKVSALSRATSRWQQAARRGRPFIAIVTRIGAALRLHVTNANQLVAVDV